VSAGSGGVKGGAAWPSKTNSVTTSQTSTRQFSNSASGKTPVEELPTVEEVMGEVVNEFPHLVGIPLSETDRRKLRAEVVEEESEDRVVSPEYQYDASFTKTEVTERRAVSWGQAVRELLEWYESYRYKTLKFGKGKPGEPPRETFKKPARNSWQPQYQQVEFARLKALERQTIGYETCGECGSYFCRRPAEHETAREPGEYEEPVVALITRSASSTPEGEYVPPVEHDRAIADSWEPVYHTIRNQLKAAGYTTEEWIYHKQGEPHEGGGEASAYGHEHTALIIETAGHEHGVDDVIKLLQPTLEKHVEACEWAESAAHQNEPCPEHDNGEPWLDAESECDDCDNPLSVSGVGEEEDEITTPASYVAKYLSVDGGSDLFERSPEYIMWAAVQWATNTRKGVRSANANHAISADLCTQAYESAEYEQVNRHGEFTRESSKRGYERECAECGSPWGVDQEHGTNVERRLMADGGTVEAESPAVVQETLEAAIIAGPEPVEAEVVDDIVGEESAEYEREEIWQDARAGAACGELLDRAKDRSRIETYLEQNPEASVPIVAGKLELPPERDDLIQEVIDGEDSSDLRSFERSAEWELESVINSRYRECFSCGYSFGVSEGMSSSGKGQLSDQEALNAKSDVQNRHEKWGHTAIEKFGEFSYGPEGADSEELSVYSEPTSGGLACPRCESEATDIRESPASAGQVDMRELKLPKQRERERHKAIIEAMEEPS